MNSLINDLKQFYRDCIYNRFKDTPDEECTYITDQHVWVLNNISYYNVQDLLEDNYDIKSILSAEDIKTYKFICYDARYKCSSIDALSYPYLFLDPTDIDELKNSLLTNPDAVHQILTNYKLCKTLNLIDNIQFYLDRGLFGYDYRTRDIIDNWFNYFAERHKVYILQLSKLNGHFATNLIIDLQLPILYRLQLFNACTDVDLEYIFKNIRTAQDELNICVFNKLISTDTNNNRTSYWASISDSLTIVQQNVIYNKYYNEMFGGVNHWRTFFDYCCKFGQVLRTKERAVLLKKLSVPSRVKNIPRAKRTINFTNEELDRLNTIELTYKLADNMS